MGGREAQARTRGRDAVWLGRAWVDGRRTEADRFVNGSVAAALRGEFGDVRFTDRTRNSELFVNPLMSLHFAVDAVGPARRNLYLPCWSAPCRPAGSAR